MADTRQYFANEAERNKALAANPGYTYGSTTGANSQSFFIEKKTLSVPEAKSLGYGQGNVGGVQTASIPELRASGRIAPPTEMNISGQTSQILTQLQKSYEAGELDPAYSARITGAGDSKKVEFFKTAKGQESVITYSEPQAVQQDAGKMLYVYDTVVDRPQQATDIVNWAKGQKGITAERVFNPSKEQLDIGFQQKKSQNPEFNAPSPGIIVEISSEIPILNDKGEWSKDLPQITITSDEALKQAQIRKSSQEYGKEIYAGANSVEKFLLNAATLLSPAGTEYVGGAAVDTGFKAALDKIPVASLLQIALPPGVGMVAGAVAGKATPNITMGKAFDAYFGKNLKGSQQVVIEHISERLEQNVQGNYAYDVDLPVMGNVKVPEVFGGIFSPVVDIETAALGGAGLGKLAATKIGAKVMGSAAGKAALIAGTGLYVGQRGSEVESLRQQGKGTEALGRTLTTAGEFLVMPAAFKAEYSYAVAKVKPVFVNLQTATERGVSRTVTRGKEILSQGEFEVTSGQAKGLKGTTNLEANPTKGRGYLTTKIPEQKLPSGQKVKAQEFTSYVQEAENKLVGIAPKEQPELARVYHRIANDMKLMVNERFAKLVGPKREDVWLKETARQTKTIASVTDTATGKTVKEQILVRRFTGIGEGNKADYQLAVVRGKSGKPILIEESVIRNKVIAKIDWVDISRLNLETGGRVTVFKPGPGGGKSIDLRPPSVVIAKIGKSTPPVPSGNVLLDENIARIVMNKNPTPTGVRIKETPRLELEVKTASDLMPSPNIIRKALDNITGRTVTPQKSITQQIQLNVPDIQKSFDATKQKIRPVEISVTNPITGQRTSQQSVQEIMQVLEPIVDRIASQPVPVVPISNIRLPPPAEIPWLAPAFFGLGGSKLKRYRTGHVTNPVPEIEKVV